MDHEQKNNGAKNSTQGEVGHPPVDEQYLPEVPKGSEFVTTEEKAQFEVFRNGSIPRETIDEWIKNDLRAIMSFVHGCLNDSEIFNALSDVYYKRYQRLHQNNNTDVKESSN